MASHHASINLHKNNDIGAIDPFSKDVKLSEYATQLKIDARYRYTVKLLHNFGRSILPDPYLLKDGWTNDPCVWPDLGFGHIYYYLIESPGIYTKETLKAYKSLEAYRFVLSGHVQVVEHNSIGDGVPYCAFKTKVIPSQRVTEKPHQPWVYLNKETADVYCAHCTCLAGLGEVCSHVAALLFKIELGVRLGLTKVASTSRACEWNKVFRKQLDPMTIEDMNPLIKGRRTKAVHSVTSSGKDPLPDENTLAALKAACPNAVFFTTIPPLDPEETESASETGENHGIVQPLRDLYCLGSVTGGNELACLTETVWNSYKCTQEQAKDLEKLTSGQSVCPLWFEQRKGRITGTKAHDVMNRRDSTNPNNLVQRITGSKCYNLSRKKAVQWGINTEEKARCAYIQEQKVSHGHLSVRSSGLLICDKKPFLAVSVDGVVSCKCCPARLLEVKCPYTHRNDKIKDIKDKDFCLDDHQQLKTRHRYFTQIQLQMYVHNVNTCDLFIFTNVDNITVPILKDIEFCDRLVGKCEQFFMTYVLPELITRTLENGENIPEPPNNTCIAHDQENSDNTPNVWCLCREPEYGRMVECFNSDCSTQWFHYECVNIRRCPRGKWLCPECSTDF